MFSSYDRWKLATPEEARGMMWCRNCDSYVDRWEYEDHVCEDDPADLEADNE